MFCYSQPVDPSNLRRIRDLLRLSQQQLADQLGVHRLTLVRWEAGDHRIPKSVAMVLTRIVADRARQQRTRRKPIRWKRVD